MTAFARSGWNATSTRVGSYAHTVGTPNGACSRAQGHFPAYRCRACDGYYTLLTGSVFEKTRQRPATLVLMLRGIAKGEPTARLARELGLSRKQLHTLRQRLQANLNDTAPTDVMRGTAFEADELYQNAGEKKHAPSRPPRSATPPGQ
jgi:transposase-like protein